MPITLQSISHIRLTVTDVARSQAFYTEHLGFRLAREVPNGVLLTQETIVLGLSAPFDPGAAPPDDRFSEHRVGLDHLSFNVGTYEELEAAAQAFDAASIAHGEIKDIGLGLVMAFRDPDNIQLELFLRRV